MQLQGIGTEWMLRTPKKSDGDAAFNQLIGQMKTMDEVRPFMCPKSNGNLKACEKCDGFRTCAAGQRMARLAEEAKRVVPVERPEQKQKEITEKDREEFVKACQSGNAWNYFMQTRRMTKDAAGELLGKMVRKFPNIAAEYGGSRRIMQRPKIVTITSLTDGGAQNEQEQASAAEVEQIQAEEKKEPEQAVKPKRGEIGTAELIRKTKELCKQALASDDPIEFLMNESGSSADAARERLRRWSKNYPELFEGVVLPSRRRLRKQDQQKEHAEKPEETMENVPAAQDDDISLEEFLSEYADETAPEPQKQAENSDPIVITMKHRLNELKAEKERLESEITSAKKRMEQIDNQRAALELCISQFEEGQL